MKKISVKIKINKLIQQLGSKKLAAEALGISLRQIYYLANGKKAPIATAIHIDNLLNK